MEVRPVPIPDFDTARLSLRRWRPEEDRPALAELGKVLTPRVLQHLPEKLQPGPGKAGIAGWVEDRLAESALFVARSRVEGHIAGLMILAAFDAPDAPLSVHVGYVLAEAEWGKGLASELLSGLIEAARPAAPLRLIGGTVRENAASVRVLEKAGFRRDPDLSDDGTIMFVRDLL
ncbi:GNAT family N-acetyltransferase [Defluviimonas sp. WL0050]|uniref:GNAT family N-acetyltransferase n=1 Tax=Albidovulum litorale TaxID=2984134 RepID=A0ABT2ZJH3_9RHOB|nr:GNAT family N-acetyltransferase [Defluviimonas sp. WL0050]MCV2871277.1 GNAT family N-acetyltransferase [Defluviimonas sp. WL0050]